VVGLDLTTMTAVHYYLSAAPYYIRVKIFQKKEEKELWAEWASVDKWVFYMPGGMPKVL
jgi:hypothetical protein